VLAIYFGATLSDADQFLTRNPAGVRHGVRQPGRHDASHRRQRIMPTLALLGADALVLPARQSFRAEDRAEL
jgi:hypothetical protein